jgi:hypothetical protein
MMSCIPSYWFQLWQFYQNHLPYRVVTSMVSRAYIHKVIWILAWHVSTLVSLLTHVKKNKSGAHIHEMIWTMIIDLSFISMSQSLIRKALKTKLLSLVVCHIFLKGVYYFVCIYKCSNYFLFEPYQQQNKSSCHLKKIKEPNWFLFQSSYNLQLGLHGLKRLMMLFKGRTCRILFLKFELGVNI